MLMTLDAPHLTLLFLATVFGLAVAFVWLFIEFERHIGKRRAPSTLARFGYRPDGRRDRKPNERD
jgi:hypothetical protein